MPKFTLELMCEDMEGPIDSWSLMEGVERHYVTLQCSNCAMATPGPVYFTDEEVEVPGGRGTANLVIKCKGCERVNNLSISSRDSNAKVTRAEQWVPGFLVLECRGIEPISYHVLSEDAGGGFSVSCSDASTTFDNVALDDDWVEYDEKADQSVGIYGVKARFARV